MITEPEPTELATVAPAALENVRSQETTLEVDVDETVHGDPERLASVFENLFRNAIEHGGPSVTVRIGSLPGEPGCFVEDDGPGVPPGERETVFEPGASSKADGTGFGLTIVRSIVAAHGWEIVLTEGDAGGARFEIHTAPQRSPPGAPEDQVPTATV